LLDSYHCSRYNTNTGVLTPQMFRDVIAVARKLIEPQPQPQDAFAARP
jgi:uracil-DNA glycosylase